MVDIRPNPLTQRVHSLAELGERGFTALMEVRMIGGASIRGQEALLRHGEATEERPPERIPVRYHEDLTGGKISTPGRVSRLYDSDQISAALLRDFSEELPRRPPSMANAPSPRSQQLPLVSLTMDEVKRAIFTAKPDNAPGPDGMPAIVCQELGPVIGRQMFIPM